jgi:hypothetical protein
MSIQICPPFWSENLAVLWLQADEFFPFSEKAQECTTTALNSLTRFSIYLSAILAIVKMNPRYLLLPALFMILTYAIYKSMRQSETVREAFVNQTNNKNILGPVTTPPAYFASPFSMPGVIPPQLLPKMSNGPDIIGIPPAGGKRALPFANSQDAFTYALVQELNFDTSLPNTASVESSDKYQPTKPIQRMLDEQYDTLMIPDETDIYQHTQSQRIFMVPPPSTSIPNDVDSLQNWLYRIPGKTCKEGNKNACVSGTEGAPITILNQ